MGIIICCACGRRRNVKPIKKRKQLVCGNCGARNPRVVHRPKVWMDTDDADGIDAHAARLKVIAGLFWQCEQKGYKPGWVGMKFKKIFGCWPNGEAAAPAEPVSADLLGWLRRDNAAYAKRMRAIEAAGAKFGQSVRAESPLMNEDDWNVKL